MNTQRILVVLLASNLAAVGLQFARGNSASPEPATPIVRTRALELVDEAGRVRAELRVLPAQPNVKMPDRTVGYPETVLLRLLTSRNGPNVKLATTEDGAGLVLGGESGYLQLLSRGNKVPMIKIVTKDGGEKILQP